MMKITPENPKFPNVIEKLQKLYDLLPDNCKNPEKTGQIPLKH
ncbi:MAG: hypothetical protein N3E51_00435 [Candidatus Micrarchaeota archaeon]|nr:hypothetical protein [Candidatus Micrarchaeota archaeon]